MAEDKRLRQTLAKKAKKAGATEWMIESFPLPRRRYTGSPKKVENLVRHDLKKLDRWLRYCLDRLDIQPMHDRPKRRRRPF